MKLSFSIIILITITACQNNKTDNQTKNTSTSFYVGTYTDGDSEGIYKYTLENDGTLNKVGLAARSENPSFLTKSANGKYLLAVNEISNKDNVGTVESYLITIDSLHLINKSSTGGAHPCFVTTNDQDYILTANYTGGNIGLLKLSTDGKISSLLDVEQHAGKGTSDRQDGPHAHSTWFVPNSNDIISIDLGTNELWFSKLDTITSKLQASESVKLKMADGAGPRHLTLHPKGKWIYVLNELNSTISLIQKNDNGVYEEKNTFSTLPNHYIENNSGADIHISADGDFLYASNRGHNSIVIYKVNNLNGSLELIGHEPTHGDSPRNFSLSPNGDYLLVANQLTNNIISFKRNKTTGLLEFVDEIEAPAPVCILF
jgi:6-phosphogluconolactonase